MKSLEERYPPKPVWCDRCKRVHQQRPSAYYKAKAREQLGSWIAAELDKQLLAGKQ